MLNGVELNEEKVKKDLEKKLAKQAIDLADLPAWDDAPEPFFKHECCWTSTTGPKGGKKIGIRRDENFTIELKVMA